MENTDPEMTKKKILQLAIIIYGLLIFSLSWRGLFKGDMVYGLLIFSFVGGIVLIGYSVYCKITDWKIFIVYGTIALGFIWYQFYY